MIPLRQWLHLLWAVPALLAINTGLLLIPKPRAERRGSKVVSTAGFPLNSDPCYQQSWRYLLHPLV